MNKANKALLIVCALSFGCSKDKPAQPAADPEFDKQWSQLTQGGVEPAFVEGQLHGGGLLGEVRRAVDTSPSGAVQSVNGPLSDADVAKVIRTHLPAVRSCYEVEERAGSVSSGKAILSLDIEPTGAVRETRVDAPSFAASKLPSCINQNAKKWTFPRSTAKDTKRVSYPFVFVGG
jgi:hypothetical protein